MMESICFISHDGSRCALDIGSGIYMHTATILLVGIGMCINRHRQVRSHGFAEGAGDVCIYVFIYLFWYLVRFPSSEKLCNLLYQSKSLNLPLNLFLFLSLNAPVPGLHL